MIENLREQLLELEHEMVGYMRDGNVIPGQELLYMEARQEAEAIRQQIEELERTETGTSAASVGEEALLEEEEVTVDVSSSASVEPLIVATGRIEADADPTYRELLHRALDARKLRNWSEALVMLDDARPFARGSKEEHALDELKATIRLEQERAEEEEQDQQTALLIEEASELARKNRYHHALLRLQEAKKTARPAKQGDLNDRVNRMEVERRALIDSLIQQFDQKIEAGVLDEARRIYSNLQQDIAPDLPALRELNNRLAIESEKRALDQKLKSLRTELEGLWKTGRADDARKAKIRADEDASNHPTDSAFLDLAQRAAELLREAERFDREISTAGQFDKILEFETDLKSRYEAGFAELPIYEIKRGIRDGKTDVLITPRGYLPRDQAFNVFAEQFAAYSKQTAQDYLERAKQQAVANPRYAEQLLIETEAFPHLDDTTRQELVKYRTREVELRVSKRQQAEDMAYSALRETDILEAWRILLNAQRLDSAAEGIAQRQAMLWSALEPIVASKLDRCVDLLRTGKWEETTREANEWLDFLPGMPAYEPLRNRAYEIKDKAIQLQAIRIQVDAMKGDMDELLQRDPDEAARRLQTLLKSAGDLESYFGFGEIRYWRDSVQAHYDLRATLSEIEAGARELPQDGLERRIERLKHLEKRRGESSELSAVLRRLTLRRKFLIAQRLYNQGGEQRDQAESALAELAEEPNEDRRPASDLLKKIREQRAQSSKASQALKDAQQAAEQHSDYARALELLREWRDQPAPLGEQIRAKIREYEKAWQERLSKQLDTFRSRPKLAPLDQIEKRLTELKVIAPMVADEWEREHMPGIYANAARIAHGTGGASYTTALLLWNRALLLAPYDPDLLAGKRATEKASTKLQVASDRARPTELLEQGLADAQSRWLEFLKNYPDDVDAFAELARLSIERERFVEALRYLHAAGEHDRTQGGTQSPSISQLRQTAEEGKDIQVTKQRIVSGLADDKTAFQYKEALDLAQQLANRHPTRFTELNDWFASHKQERIRTLKAKMLGLPQDDAERWTLAIKILTLDSRSPEGNAEVSRAVMIVEALIADTEALLNSYTGIERVKTETGLTQAIEPAQALFEQVREAIALRERAYSISDRLAQQALSLGENSRQQSARECVEKINARIKELQKLADLVREARAKLRTACSLAFSGIVVGRTSGTAHKRADARTTVYDDPFKAVSDVLGDISQSYSPYSQHLTILALSRDLAQATQNRTAIENELNGLHTALGSEEFGQALRHIDRLRTLDTKGDFELVKQVLAYDSWTKEEISLLGPHSDEDSLETRLAQRDEQWQRVDTWQGPMGLSGWQDGQPIPETCQRLSWQQHAATQCIQLRERGLFKEARQLIQEVVGDEHSSVPRLQNRWSLRRSLAYLADAQDVSGATLIEVLDQRYALSHRVQAVYQARMAAIQAIRFDLDRLLGPRSDGQASELEQLKQDQADFYGYQEAIGERLQQLQTKRFGLFPLGREQRMSVCNDLDDLIQRAKRIAPHYEGWKAITPQIQDACPGSVVL